MSARHGVSAKNQMSSEGLLKLLVSEGWVTVGTKVRKHHLGYSNPVGPQARGNADFQDRITVVTVPTVTRQCSEHSPPNSYRHSSDKVSHQYASSDEFADDQISRRSGRSHRT